MEQVELLKPNCFAITTATIVSMVWVWDQNRDASFQHVAWHGWPNVVVGGDQVGQIGLAMIMLLLAAALPDVAGI